MIENQLANVDAHANLPRRGRVTAVIVSLGRTPFLADTLRALGEQTRKIETVLFVDAHPDADTDDGTAAISELVNESAGRGMKIERVVAPRARNLGQAVRHGLSNARTSSVGDHPDDLLWLLHDDSAPRPGALEALVTAVELSDSVVIAGPKQLDEAGHRVLEVGVTTSRFGRRLTGIEDGEVDQGQHDHLDDVLAVGTAGMLIRASAWARLGGTDPSLGPYLDGLDLSRRARLAGYRVIVVPAAVIWHAQASQTGARDLVPSSERTEPAEHPESTEHPEHPEFTEHTEPTEPTESAEHLERLEDPSAGAVLQRRRAFVHTQLVWTPLPLLPFVAVLSVVSSLVRAMWRIATKDLALVAPELVAPWAALSHPVRVFKARRQAASTTITPRRALRPLQKSIGDVYRYERDRLRQRRSSRDRGPALNQLELADRHEVARRRRGALALVVATLIGLTAIVLGPALWSTPLTGGALLPATGTLGQLWESATSGWNTYGLGSPAPADPFIVLLLLPTIFLGGSPQIAVSALYVGAIVASGIGAWFAAGAATRSIGMRAWAALVWAIAPTIQIAMSTGRIGSLLAHALLPWVALAVARALGPVATDPGKRVRPAGSLAAAAAGGLALAVASAGSILLLPLAALVFAAVAVAVPRPVAGSPVARHRGRLLLVLAPSLVVWAPYLVHVIANPRILAAQPGLPTGSEAVSGWQYLLGMPSGSTPWPFGFTLGDFNLAQLGPLAFGGVLAVIAFLALLRAGTAERTVRLGWAIAALGVATATIVASIQVAVAVSFDVSTATSIAEIVSGWPGPAVSVVLLGLLLAVLTGWTGVLERLRKHSFGWRQVGAGFLAAAAVLIPLASATAWAWNARTDTDAAIGSDSATVKSLDGPVVPAVALAAQESADRAKTLILRVDSANIVQAQLVRTVSPSITEVSSIVEALTPSGEPSLTTADRALMETVAQVVANNGLDPTESLSALGVGAILVPPGGSAAHTAELAAALDSTPGLNQVVHNDQGTLWWVNPENGGATIPVARVRIVDEAGTQLQTVDSSDLGARATIAQGAGPRWVVLAERADPGWVATLDGEPLTRRDAGWAQSFELPRAGGELRIDFERPWRVEILLVQGLVLLVCGLLAVPIRRRGLAGSYYAPFPRPGDVSDAVPPAADTASAAEPVHLAATERRDLSEDPDAAVAPEAPDPADATDRLDLADAVDPAKGLDPVNAVDPAKGLDPVNTAETLEPVADLATQSYAPRRTLRARKDRSDEGTNDE